MILPISQTIVIYSKQVDLILFIMLGAFFVSLLLFWNEARKDGFDEEKSLDLFIIINILSLLLSRFFYAVINNSNLSLSEISKHVIWFWSPGYEFASAFLVSVLVIYIFCKRWNWSIYRIYDIFAISVSSFVGFYCLGRFIFTNILFYLFYFLFFTLLTVLLIRLRSSFASGIVFSIFLVFLGLTTLVINRDLVYLIFCILLFTISLLIYFKRNKAKMKSNLPKSFINKAKQTLLRKDKKLKKEEETLITNDPYFEDGRDSDNADFLDDVAEDVRKEASDYRLKHVRELRSKIAKALAKINLGTYGIDDVTGKPIDKKRLEVYPEATTNIDTESHLESQ